MFQLKVKGNVAELDAILDPYAKLNAEGQVVGTSAAKQITSGVQLGELRALMKEEVGLWVEEKVSALIEEKVGTMIEKKVDALTRRFDKKFDQITALLESLVKGKVVVEQEEKSEEEGEEKVNDDEDVEMEFAPAPRVDKGKGKALPEVSWLPSASGFRISDLFYQPVPLQEPPLEEEYDEDLVMQAALAASLVQPDRRDLAAHTSGLGPSRDKGKGKVARIVSLLFYFRLSFASLT